MSEEYGTHGEDISVRSVDDLDELTQAVSLQKLICELLFLQLPIRDFGTTSVARRLTRISFRRDVRARPSFASLAPPSFSTISAASIAGAFTSLGEIGSINTA